MRILVSLLLFLVMSSVTVYAEGQNSPNERLSEIKQKRNLVVQEEQKENAILQCGSGKQKIIEVQKNSNSALNKRIIVYSDIQKEVKAIELRMAKQGADASEIDLFIGSLQQSLDRLGILSRSSQQLSDDISTIDCSTGYELYKSATEEYLEIRGNILVELTTVKSTITNSPSQTFEPLIGRLKL